MLVISVKSLAEIEKATLKADLIELRLDCFAIEKKPDFPCIFTFRKNEEGGECKILEEKRLEIIEKYLLLAPEYLDIEADTDPKFIEKIARLFPHVKLIGSYHNFKKTPKDLEAVLKGMQNPHFSIYKMALFAETSLDMLRLMAFARKSSLQLSAISIGPFGRPSRALGPIVGNALDYVGLEEDKTLGRYDLETLLEVYHYRKLNRETLIYALIGSSIEMSPGHLFHNPRFKHNAVYLKIPLEKDQLKRAFELFRELPFGGLSITMPLKESVLEEVDSLSLDAKAIGAINTVTFRNKKAIGTNTDGVGAIRALEKTAVLKGKRLAIIGAGGTAKAIAYEAKKKGAIVSLFNRTAGKCGAFSLEKLKSFEYDILVNTSPAHDIRAPLKKVVMDVVYFPKETPFLVAAKRAGARCVYGEEMFIEQALMQQKEWSVE